ncbi:class I SAM-dependent methyltransferase [Lonsdalea quercina]|uniref:class I SAM-dependent methyltransferase n=1 Tax=Lonsdalea quercina TaxID=71657 RepID=UPI0039771AFA
MQLDNLLNEIVSVNSHAIDEHSLFSMAFYDRLQHISKQFSAARRENATVFNTFIETHKNLLAILDHKALDYEMKYEEKMSLIMSRRLAMPQSELEGGGNNRNKFIDFYRQLYNAERELIGINVTNVCHVGCGPMPTSVLMWAKYSACQITALDIIQDAVTQAHNVFDCWRIPKGVEGDRVRFLCQPGETFDYKDMDAIILSSSILNKKNLYAAIKKTITKTVDVIEREPNFLYESVYLNADEMREQLIAKTTLNNVNIRLYRLSPEK